MYGSSMVGLADIVRCAKIATSDKQLDGMAKACGYERKPADTKVETVNKTQQPLNATPSASAQGTLPEAGNVT